MTTKLLNNFTNKGQRYLAISILALVTLVGLVGPAHAADPEFDFATQTLRVGVWINNLDEGDVLDRGQEMAVGFQTNKDAYAVVYRINTEGLVTILWPRSRMDDGFVFGGHEYLVPVTGSRHLAASNRAGEGFVEAIISQYPFDLRELALDFHHEYEAEKFEFMVSGDPFLAINEVNFAVTGMKDSEDFVVTNYLSYYVHEEVDHPRYLCTQCHLDDGLADYPYGDQCTIEITVNHEWGNDWYDGYGYYPIYHNPVYVYYDPWTWRPWVNFWYDPFYRCPTRPGYYYNSPAYVWCDSPYYRYDGARRKTGRGLYTRPGPNDAGYIGRTKTSDYTGVSGQVAHRGPSDGERETMRQKRRVQSDVSGRSMGGQSVRVPSPSVASRGEKPMVRPRPNINTPERGSSRGGLQIKKTGGRRPAAGEGGSRVGENRQVRTTPVRGNPGARGNLVGPGGSFSVGGQGGSGSGGTTTLRGNSRPNPSRDETIKPTRGRSGNGRIKPVEPRKKGTRIWNSRSAEPSSDRKVRNSPRNSSRNTPDRQRNSGSTVRSRNESSRSGNSGSSSSPKVKAKSSNRGSSGSSTVRSGSSGGSRGSSGGSTQRSSGSGSSKSGGSSRSRR